MNYVEQVEKELLEKCDDIPFGNSIYQDENFVLNTSYTEARAVRNIGLLLADKVSALRALRFSMERLEVDLNEIESKIPDALFFQKARLEIDKREKISGIAYTKKLLKDALYEVEYLRAVLAKLPKLSRSEFEAQEKQYFIASLTRQCVALPEAAKSLEAMGVMPEKQYEFFNGPTLSERLGVSTSEALPDGAKVLQNLLG